jgi:hypothetical protein
MCVLFLCPAHLNTNLSAEQHEEILEKWQKESEILCETRAYQRVKSEIASKDIVTIISGPGMGKTFIARQVCLYLHNEGWDIIPVQNIDDMTKYRFISIHQVFLLDDPVGVFGFDRSTSAALEKCLRTFLSQIKRNSFLPAERLSIMNAKK